MLGELRYKSIKTISRLICTMSYKRILCVGQITGPFIMNRIEKQKKRGINQICLGMGYTEEEAQRLLQKVYEHIGMSALEMLYMPRLLKDKQHVEEYIRIDHPEYLEKAFEEGRGIIGLTAHMGNWEWLGAGLALYDYRVSAIGKKQRNAALMEIINEYRAQSGQHIFLTGTGGYELIAAVRAMKKNYIVGFLSDKDGGKSGIPVQFMNRTFSFPQGPVTFAKRFRAPVIPIFIVRNPDGVGHTICVRKPFYYEETGNERQDLLDNAQKMASVMEGFIKEYPTEWLWFQHLFWTGPEKIKMLHETEKETAHE